jgi:hypothetical protein
MTYNLVKTSVPSLVDKQLAMKIAKLNNIDYNTGISLPEPPKPPSQFELLCGDIKESIFLFIRKNIMLILFFMGIFILLTIRYFQVKRQKELELKQYELYLKNQEKEKEKEKEKEEKEKEKEKERGEKEKLINFQTTIPIQNNEIDMLRQSFNNYDDSKNKKYYIKW